MSKGGQTGSQQMMQPFQGGGAPQPMQQPFNTGFRTGVYNGPFDANGRPAPPVAQPPMQQQPLPAPFGSTGYNPNVDGFSPFGRSVDAPMTPFNPGFTTGVYNGPFGPDGLPLRPSFSPSDGAMGFPQPPIRQPLPMPPMPQMPPSLPPVMRPMPPMPQLSPQEMRQQEREMRFAQRRQPGDMPIKTPMFRNPLI